MSSVTAYTDYQIIAEEVELQRLEALKGYKILDTPFEPEYYQLVTQAAAICETPISLITLITEDRQWFKARFGVTVNEIPRSVSFCQYAITQDDVLEVPDALMDLRFYKNPLVTGDPKIRFYAGAPLVTEQGYRLGTLW